MFKITHLTSLKCSLLLQKHSVLRAKATPKELTLLGLGLIKINTVLANLNNPRPSLILNN